MRTYTSFADVFAAGVCSFMRCFREIHVAIGLLAIHAALLSYSATQHSPTNLEPALLASGINHWHFGRFELYRVNPPLPRMVASLPVLAMGCKTDWSSFFDSPGSRAEFPVGEDFIRANGPNSRILFCVARWACIPFSLIGGFFAFRWSSELYGKGAGLITLVIWTIEPNLVAHAELITPDCACWSFGILAGYTYWRWLKRPTWKRTIIAGVCLGLALLTKFTWIIFFGLWPLLWLLWIIMKDPKTPQGLMEVLPLQAAPQLESSAGPAALTRQQVATPGATPLMQAVINAQLLDHRAPKLLQLATLFFISIYLLNLGYGCDGTFTQLKDFSFVSSFFTGLEKAGLPGNRFRNTLLGRMPMPVPKQYLLGIDSQKSDFESWVRPSYLRGQWKQGGWWYYYIYGLCVKVPCGILALLTGILIGAAFGGSLAIPLRDELVLIAPAIAVLALVSSQTEFSEHLRYVFPSLAMVTVACGRSIVWFRCRNRLLATVPVMLLTHAAISCGANYPNQLAYFNEFAGGPKNGWRHLLGSSFDWGQNLLTASDWSDSTGGSEPAILFYSGMYDWFSVSGAVDFIDEPLANGGLSLNGRSVIVCQSLWAEKVAVVRRPRGTALMDINSLADLLRLRKIEGHSISPTLELYRFPKRQ